MKTKLREAFQPFLDAFTALENVEICLGHGTMPIKLKDAVQLFNVDAHRCSVELKDRVEGGLNRRNAWWGAYPGDGTQTYNGVYFQYYDGYGGTSYLDMEHMIVSLEEYVGQHAAPLTDEQALAMIPAERKKRRKK